MSEQMTLDSIYDNILKINKNLRKQPSREYTVIYLINLNKKLNELKEKHTNIIKLVTISKSDKKLINDRFSKIFKDTKEKIKHIKRGITDNLEELNTQNSIIESDYSDTDIDDTLVDNNITILDDTTTEENITEIINIENHIEMAKFNLETALKIIPDYNGESNKLESFLSIVDMYHDSLEDKEKLIIFIKTVKLGNKIKNRITGKKTDTLSELKNALNETQVTKKNALNIYNQLNTIRQQDNSTTNFGEKIENLIAELNSIQIKDKDNIQKETIIKINDEIGLNSFKNGLSEPFKTTVFAARPATLTEAITLANDIQVSNQNKVFHMRTYNQNFNNYRRFNYSRNHFQTNANTNSQMRNGNRNVQQQNRNFRGFANRYNQAQNRYNANNRNRNTNNRFNGNRNHRFKQHVKLIDSKNGGNPLPTSEGEEN